MKRPFSDAKIRAAEMRGSVSDLGSWSFENFETPNDHCRSKRDIKNLWRDGSCHDVFSKLMLLQ